MELDKDEKALAESFERDDWKPDPNFEAQARRLQAAARATFRKDKRVNIRISEKDLAGLKKRAVEEGLPYQTLTSSVLHKFVTGRLADKTR